MFAHPADFERKEMFFKVSTSHSMETFDDSAAPINAVSIDFSKVIYLCTATFRNSNQQENRSIRFESPIVRSQVELLDAKARFRGFEVFFRR